jgi:hypothetical protein
LWRHRRLFRSGPEQEALPNHQQFVSDIESIEFYSDASKFQAGACWKTLAGMRSAVARLLPLVTLPASKGGLAEMDMQRLEAIADRVTCLSRQMVVLSACAAAMPRSLRGGGSHLATAGRLSRKATIESTSGLVRAARHAKA